MNALCIHTLRIGREYDTSTSTCTPEYSYSITEYLYSGTEVYPYVCTSMFVQVQYLYSYNDNPRSLLQRPHSPACLHTAFHLSS
jgi:hypothetical protein